LFAGFVKGRRDIAAITKASQSAKPRPINLARPWL